MRITDAATIEIVEMVLAGSINKQIVGFINGAGGKAIGLCGKDGNMVVARKATRSMVDPESNIEKIVDLGFVGEPENVDAMVLDQILGRDLIPVLAPLATSREGVTFNVNADTFAGAIAGALKAKRLLLLTDVPGVLDKSKSLIKQLSADDARRADRRRHHLRRHDPQGGDLHLCARSRRRGRRHPRRQGAARGAARAPHRSRRRHADDAVISPDQRDERDSIPAPLARIPGGVWALGLVSLLMDLSSEMIHALLPLYLVTVLGASALTVGVIEGIAEATAAIVKIFSGALSDRLGKRKLLAASATGSPPSPGRSFRSPHRSAGWSPPVSSTASARASAARRAMR